MQKPTFTRYPVLWNERAAKVLPVKTEITIDLDKLAELLARKALKSKRGTAAAFFGAVRVKVS